MTIAFVIGNGISRKDINLDLLRTRGPIYGCNALYREYTPDVLVATDRPIATMIQHSGYAKTNKFYTRRPLEDLGGLRVPEQYFGYSSGPIAVSLAALDGHRRIYLLGFDMGPTQNKQFNNVYAGTEFYKPVDAMPTYTGNWLKQIKHIAKDFSNTQLIRICGATTARLAELEDITNLSHQDVVTFLDCINNKKDL